MSIYSKGVVNMSVEQIAGKGFKFDWDFPIESLPNGNFGVGAVCVVEGRQFITTQYQHASKAMCLLTAIMKVVELELTGWVELKLLANNVSIHPAAQGIVDLYVHLIAAWVQSLVRPGIAVTVQQAILL